MNILILDDDESRHRGFIDAFRDCGHDLTHAWTSQEANGRLHGTSGEPRFDVVFLDHDLGEFGEHSLGTGLHVAREVALLADDRMPLLVIVHSHNPEGAHQMMQALVKADVPAERFAFCESLLKRCRTLRLVSEPATMRADSEETT